MTPLRLGSQGSSTCRGGAPHAAAAKQASTQARGSIRSEDQLLMTSLNADHPGADDKPTVEEPARCPRIDDVLLPQDSGRQAPGGVIGPHRYCRLNHDRAVIELGAHEVNGAAMQLHARGERTRMR